MPNRLGPSRRNVSRNPSNFQQQQKPKQNVGFQPNFDPQNFTGQSTDFNFPLSQTMQTQQNTLQRQRPPMPPQSQPMRRQPNQGSQDVNELKHTVNSLKTDITQWNQILQEVVQSVYVMNATCTVPNIPYYTELPETKEALRASAGVLKQGQMVLFVYPQFAKHDMVYQRIRVCDPDNGAMQLFYVPIKNLTLSNSDLMDFAGINSDAEQYFDGFHNPGHPDPWTSAQYN